MKKHLSTLLVFALCTPPAWATEYFILPAASRLEGVGGIYGLAAGADKIFSERTKVIAGASAGQVQAEGLGLLDLPLGMAGLGFNLGFASVQKARFQTSYSRGLTQSDSIEQEISATAYGATIDWLTLNKMLKLSAGLVLSEVHLDDFYIDGERITRPNKAGYHSVKTSSKILALDWDGSGVENRQGFDLGVGLTTAEGRIGQSDLLMTNWRGSFYVPLFESLTLAFNARWSDSAVTKKESRYLDAASAKAALSTGCASIANATEQARCQQLEDSIADYVARSNSAGTAAPIGGSNGLRAYNELSVRAAHTRLASLELRWILARIKSVDLALTPFYDLGWSSDSNGDVFKTAADSYGIGLRATYKSLPLRLAYAQGKAESAWFLAIGQTY